MADTKRRQTFQEAINNGEIYVAPESQSATPTRQTAQTQSVPVQQTQQPQAAAGIPASAAYSLHGNFNALQQQASRIAQQNRIQHVNTSGQVNALNTWRDTAGQRISEQVDRGVTQGVNELARVQEDAEEQYRTQQNQIDLDEQRSLDNRAAYDAARGVRGGIAAEQYSSIMNTAATNRVTVNNARTKLATDVARQMAELRANGEFQKAQALYQLEEQYQQQLIQIDQWAQSANISIDQYNAQLDQWALNYNAELEKLGLEQYRWEQTFSYQKERDQVADSQWRQTFDRNVLESDRAYNRGVLESDRAYNRNVLESDRAFKASEEQRAFQNNVTTQELNLRVQQYRDALEQQARENGWKQQQIDLQVRAYEDGLRQQTFQNDVTTRQLESQERSQRYNEVMTMIEQGFVPDRKSLQEFNIPYEEAATKASLARAKEALGIGVSASGTGGVSGATFESATAQLFEDAKASGNPQSYITNNYKKYGLSSSSGLYADYKNWLSGSASGGMSYDEALKAVNAGIWSDDVYNGLRTHLSDSDIQRTYGVETGDDDKDYPYVSRFQAYMSAKKKSESTQKVSENIAKRPVDFKFDSSKGTYEVKLGGMATQRFTDAERFVNYINKLGLSPAQLNALYKQMSDYPELIKIIGLK